MNDKKVVLSLSGGMDSATLFGYFKSFGYDVYPVIFNYGSKHNKHEIKCAHELCEFYGSKPVEIALPYINELFKSNLLSSGDKIPEGHYEDVTMDQTVVPGRNIIFISNMIGYAWSVGASKVAIGAHSGDHHIYADCREIFINAMDVAVRLGSDNKVQLTAPFINMNKGDIVRLGYSFLTKVPYEKTRTCYCADEISCGKCGSCTERLEAFSVNNLVDPIEYCN